MPDPVAWTMIEPGWKVLDAAGEEVGRVHEVTGDANADIFDGLTVKQGFSSRTSTCPSEHVAAIHEGEVSSYAIESRRRRSKRIAELDVERRARVRPGARAGRAQVRAGDVSPRRARPSSTSSGSSGSTRS